MAEGLELLFDGLDKTGMTLIVDVPIEMDNGMVRHFESNTVGPVDRVAVYAFAGCARNLTGCDLG